MSQQHKEQLVRRSALSRLTSLMITIQLRASLIQRDESIDDAINYRVQVLQALGPSHDLFERGCVDLLTILIDTRMIAKTLGAVADEYGREGNVTSVTAVMKIFTSAATTVLSRTGLGGVRLKQAENGFQT